ncbi:MAG: PspC domain-containing protein [Candidatus Nanopelagicales bacterium]
MSQSPRPRRVERSVSDRWLGGVAGGLAEHFATPSWVFRAAFVVATLLGGLGLLTYALMWVFLPLQMGDDAALRDPRARPGGWDLTGILGLVALGLGLLMALSALGAPIRVSSWGPVLLVGAGVALLWRQSDDTQRAMIRARAQAGVHATAEATDRMLWARILAGLGLVLVGVLAAIGPRVDVVTGLRALASVGAVIAGCVLIALPWLSAWVKGMQAERFAAIRNEERALMAARVHDSVLQTLTLIQRRAADPVEVARLARAEERALRSWLYAPAGASGSLGAALAEVVAATEADYGARIELVTVGDTTVDDRVAGLVAATREAVLNAVKHAGAPAAVYSEVSDDQVEVNVRDRGRGFDPESIDEDRHGVRESIVARINAVGGRAVIRSVPGEGTEVRLILPTGGDRG